MLNASNLPATLSEKALTTLKTFESVFDFDNGLAVYETHDELKAWCASTRTKLKDLFSAIWGLPSDSPTFKEKRGRWDSRVSMARKRMAEPKEPKQSTELTKAQLKERVKELEAMVQTLQAEKLALIDEIVNMNMLVQPYAPTIADIVIGECVAAA